jgi:hypothetical protein
LFAIAKSGIAKEHSAAAFVVGNNRVPNLPGDMVRDLSDGRILGHGSLFGKPAVGSRASEKTVTKNSGELRDGGLLRQVTNAVHSILISAVPADLQVEQRGSSEPDVTT